MNKDKHIEEMANIIGSCKSIADEVCDKHKTCAKCKAERVYNAGYRKQSEWISVEDRLPEDVYGKGRKKITVLVCTKSGMVSLASRQRIVKFDKDKMEWVELDIFEWSKGKCVTHWMPLPEAPKMKGGEHE